MTIKTQGTQTSLVQTKPEKFENTAIFLRLGPLSALIRHENGAFLKNLKTPAVRFRVEEKKMRNEAFRKR